MAKKHSALSIILIFAFVFSLSGASAYTVFPSKETETLKEWEFAGDYFKSDSPQASTWGDSYGNRNVWNVSYEYEGKKTAASFTGALGLPQMYSGDLNNNKGSNGYFYFGEPNEAGEKTSYCEVGKGYSFYLTWTSPIDGIVRFNLNGLSRWAKTYPTYFAVYNNENEAGELGFSATGENVGKKVSTLLKVSKGDTISTRVYLDGTNVNGAVVHMNVSQVRTALMSEDYNKTWTAIDDYYKSGVPSASEWGDSYGNNKTWNISFLNTEDNTEKKAVFKNSPARYNWFHPDKDNIYLYDDGKKLYGVVRGSDRANVNWVAAADETIIAKLTATCVYGNTQTGIVCSVLKNGEPIKSETVIGKKATKAFETKVTVQTGDVISFAVQIKASGGEGFWIWPEVEARHGIQITEDPTFTYTDAEGNEISEPTAGGKAKISLPIYNASANNIKATVFMALYGTDNTLIGITKTDCGEIGGESEQTAICEIETEEAPSKISVYAWDSEAGMKPYYSGYTKSF